MKLFKTFNLFIVLFFGLIFSACSDSSSSDNSDLQLASSERQFVWNAMNFWYFWQPDVPELADNQEFFDSQQAFQDFLMSFDTTEDLFVSLHFQADDFSFFIDNFEVFEQSQQGISQDFGFKFGLVQISGSNDVFGYVQFVLPDTPADTAGLLRGDIFTRVNGTKLTVDNFRDVLNSNRYDLTMAVIENSSINETGETITVEATTIEENPVFISKIIDAGGTSVGYLMYNAFQSNSHENLNNVFNTFISEGVQELVVDLRYNGGGSLTTSAALATMISGLGSDNEFGELTFSPKRSGQNQSISFLDQLPIFNNQGQQVAQEPINTLSLNRVYILTGFGTASASEVVINGLEPYIDVILIGRQTVGKDEGSLTLYDAPEPYTDKSQANPEHKKAIQPIILKIQNVEGEDYPTGFTPDFDINEIAFLENLPPLGNPSDPLLSKALEEISGGVAAKAASPTVPFRGRILFDSRDLRPFGKEMYVLPDVVKKFNF